MRKNDKSQPVLVRSSLEELLQRLDATRRGANRDDRKTRRHSLRWHLLDSAPSLTNKLTPNASRVPRKIDARTVRGSGELTLESGIMEQTHLTGSFEKPKIFVLNGRM